MVSRLHRRRHWILASTLLAASCADTPASNRPNAFVLTEGPGGRFIRMPCRVLPGRIAGDWPPKIPAVFTDYPHGWSRYGAYRGISGAPVYTPDGDWIGAAAIRLQWFRSGPGLGILPAAEIEDLWTLSRRLGESVPVGTEPMPATSGIVPGSSVCAQWVWGDLTAGVTGVVMARRGDEALMLGHNVGSSSQGPVLLAVFHAPVLALVPDFHDASSVCVVGEPVGTATYDSRRGLYVRLGVPSPRVDVRLTIRRAGGEGSYERSYHIVKSATHCRTGLTRCLSSGISGFGVHDTDTDVDGVLRVEGDSGTAFQARGGFGLELLQAIGQEVDKLCGAVVLDRNRVEVELVFPETVR